MNPLALMKLAAEKTAKTRAAEEAAKALQAGDAATAEEIARGYRKLDLAPRHVKDISIGGGEAGVDLMMGVPRTADAGKLPSGSKDSSFVVRKLYKPDSRLHRGEGTRTVLQHKQEATDIARRFAPKHITAMGGFQEPSPGKFISYHEYIPNLQTWDPKKQRGGHAESALDILENNLIRPMDRNEGYYLHDTVMRHGGRHTGSQRVVNPGNVAMIPGARGGYVPKVLDFLPYKGNEDPYLGPGVPGSAYGEAGDKTLDDLRKDVFSGKGGSRQPKKVRVAAGMPKPSSSQLSGALSRFGKFVKKHPVATGTAALGVLGGGYLLHKKLTGGRNSEMNSEGKNMTGGEKQEAVSAPKKKAASADPFFAAFFDEMSKLSGVEHIIPGALWGAGSGAVGGALGDISHPITGASYGALTGGALGGAMSGVLGPGSVDRVVGIPMIAGSTASAIAGKKREQKARKLGRELYG